MSTPYREISRDEVMQMEADSDIDELIQVRLMGGFKGAYEPGLGHYVEELPDYSQDVGAAWKIIDVLTGGNDKAVTVKYWMNSALVRFGPLEVRAETLPLAICRLGLLTTLKSGAKHQPSTTI